MNNSTGKRVGVLLAGGASKRMGQNKAKLLFEGETLFARGCRLLKGLIASKQLDEFVVSGTAAGHNSRIVLDEFPHKGPAGGIFSTIKTLGLNVGDMVIAIPVDMPLLDEKLLQDLITASCEHAQSFCYQNAWLPISVVITHELLEAIKQQEHDQRGLSVKQILMFNPGQSLEPDSAQQLANVNTPEQWKQISGKKEMY